MILNEEQKKAVDANERFLFLLAGAGSGKTRVLTTRIKKLIDEGICPKQILAITFTNKAKEEMKERIQNEDVDIYTFHGFCYHKLIDLGLNFDMIDEKNIPFHQDDLLKISKYKNSLYRTTKPYLYEKYQAYLRQNKSLDFDDLLLIIYDRLKRKSIRFSYLYILVDEFQDTNPLQYAILKLIANRDTHIFCVGDPDQSIYQFRGATKEIIDLFIKDYQAKTYYLHINYRSIKDVVILSNRLIERNHRTFKKRLIPSKISQGLIFHTVFENEIVESLWITKLIQSFIKRYPHHHKIAILYRHHHRIYELELKLHEFYIPFQIDDTFVMNHPKVFLLTIHQAKGLEFDSVIILGLENGSLPSYQISTKKELEEERRLMFVAMTRAKENLILTQVKCLNQTHFFTPSPFILESGIKKISHKQLNDIISLGDYHGYQTKNE